MNPQLQNWDNFCQYHTTGDWHGTWTKYSSEAKEIDSFRGIRSFVQSSDGNQIYHHNHYIYDDGNSESQTFETKNKPLTLSLFLDTSFSWGATKRELNSTGERFGYQYLDTWKWVPFFFETGFRYEDRRASTGAVYDEKGNFQYILVITEHLGKFVKEPALPSYPTGNEFNYNWQGMLKKITPDYRILDAVETSWQPLNNLAEDYLTLHLNGGISVSCPQTIEIGKEFFVAVDWRPNSTLLQRGIRYYDTSDFTHFTLEVFTKVNREN